MLRRRVLRCVCVWPQDRLVEVQTLRRALRRERQAAYEAAIVEQREWVDRALSADIFEDLGDEMREWVRSWYYDVLKLPKYPTEKVRKLVGALLGLPKKTPKDMFPVEDPVLPGIPRECIARTSTCRSGEGRDLDL